MASSSYDPVSRDWQPTRPDMSRKSSVIIPSTGARVRDRNYTLTPSGHTTPTHASKATDTTPLLTRSDSRPDREEDRRSWRYRAACAGYFGFWRSKRAQAVIKCSLAYFIGSLATFVTPISKILGHYDGKHLVATCAVYFHPARSIGSMHQATVFAICAWIYSSLVSIGSMGLSILFAEWDLIELGHALVLVIFCAGGLGMIGYVKHTLANPTVSVACSLASISIITILTKEGSVQLAQFKLGKVYQVSAIVFSAIVISNVLAFTLWPSSAIKELRQLMIKTTDSFSDSLSLLTHSFLSGSDAQIKSSKFASTTANERAVFGPLLKNLAEARFEHFVRGTEQEYHQEKLLIQSMQRLSQNIGGLRSAAATQFSLLQQAQKQKNPDPKSMSTPALLEASQLFSPPDQDSRLARSSSWISTPGSMRSLHETIQEEDEDEQPLLGPISIFEEFIYYLGPPMKSLAWTSKMMLIELPFGPAPKHHIEINPKFRESLRKAIDLYSEKRAEALNALYRSEAITKTRSLEQAADVEEIAASCGYFSYCLQYFAEEMICFLDILEELQRLQDSRTRTWRWLLWWKPREHNKEDAAREELAMPSAADPAQSPLKRQRTIPNVSPEVAVPFSYKIWKGLSVLRSDSIKFSIKVGVGAAIYTLPAFVRTTRPFFTRWRGEWGLVSYMIVISMTIGQTNNSGEARVLGTVIGAVLALVAWLAFPENPYALSIFGWLVSMPCFWIILNWKQGTFGRFILLTYNLSALYAYSLSMADDEDDDDEGGVNPIITDIVLHRFVSVTVGVLWGMLINRMIWPISARKQLRKALSVLWLRMALIWNKDPLSSVIREDNNNYLDMAKQSSLEKALVQLNSLSGSAVHEFRLKGPFPAKEYQLIIKANQNIVDAFHGMSVMIAKDPTANRREAEILSYTSKERSDLCARIGHLFYVLGGSIRLGFPLPESLPNTIRARDRLLAKLFDYRSRVRGQEGKTDEDFALIYAFVLVTARISESLDECVRNVELLYGVLEEEMLEI